MRNYDGAEIAWANRLVQTTHVHFGQIKYLPGGYCGPRRQKDYQLVIVKSGAARVSVDQGVRELPAEQAALFLPGRREHFVFSPDAETEHVWCSIRPDFMPPDLRRRLTRSVPLVACSESMHRIFATALGYRQVSGPAIGRVVEFLGLALFAEFLSQVELGAQPGMQDEALARAMAWIEEHYREEDCLAEARRAARCSESGLNQRFRQFLGTSPARYLWRSRVERGVAMLRNTGLTVSEISVRCGCKNPFHFSRLITRSQGMSPRELRRRAWL